MVLGAGYSMLDPATEQHNPEGAMVAQSMPGSEFTEAQSTGPERLRTLLT